MLCLVSLQLLCRLRLIHELSRAATLLALDVFVAGHPDSHTVRAWHDFISLPRLAHWFRVISVAYYTDAIQAFVTVALLRICLI